MSVADELARFDDLVSQANGAMIGIVTGAADEIGACLVGFHCQCSIEPRRYAVWVSKANHTFRVASQSTFIAVHWFRPDQRDVAVALGTVSADDDEDKIERLALTVDASTGAPVLVDSAGYFVGRVVDNHDDGDHVCFVLEVAAASDPFAPDRLRFADVADLDAGHPAEDPPQMGV